MPASRLAVHRGASTIRVRPFHRSSSPPRLWVGGRACSTRCASATRCRRALPNELLTGSRYADFATTLNITYASVSDVDSASHPAAQCLHAASLMPCLDRSRCCCIVEALKLLHAHAGMPHAYVVQCFAPSCEIDQRKIFRRELSTALPWATTRTRPTTSAAVPSIPSLRSPCARRARILAAASRQTSSSCRFVLSLSPPLPCRVA